jgi:TRAP-type C4-dicarboxylate transport system permease small subunit
MNTKKVDRHKLLPAVAQAILFVLFIGFILTSLALMTLAYHIIPNYVVQGQPVSVLLGPLVNASVGIVFFIVGVIWLILFGVVRHQTRKH